MNFWQDVYTVWLRDMLTFRRRIGRALLSSTVMPLLLLTAFGWGLGRGVHVAGGRYIDFVVPGILAQCAGIRC